MRILPLTIHNDIVISNYIFGSIFIPLSPSLYSKSLNVFKKFLVLLFLFCHFCRQLLTHKVFKS